MGLDITAYSEVKLLQEKNEDIECLYTWSDDFEEEYSDAYPTTVLSINESFPRQSEGLVEGVYMYSSYDDTSFRCSYSGWSEIRNFLAKACGYKKISVTEISLVNPTILDIDSSYWRDSVEKLPYQHAAFNGKPTDRLHYLLNFSDCEGVINNRCCKTILEDLLWLKEKDKENPCLEDYTLSKLNQLISVFGFAANNNGVVEFH